MIEAVKQIYKSFKRYESYELESKTTNHHNCRKSALLSMLLLKNKLLTVLGIEEGAGQVEQSVQNFIDLNSTSYKASVLTYAERYFELSSMIFDLFPFIPFLSETTRREIADSL